MTFETNVVGFPKTYVNIMQNLGTSQDYISGILQDFATKFCSLLILYALFSYDVGFVNLAWIKI